MPGINKSLRHEL